MHLHYIVTCEFSKKKDQKLIKHFLRFFFLEGSVPHDDTITSILNIKAMLSHSEGRGRNLTVAPPLWNLSGPTVCPFPSLSYFPHFFPFIFTSYHFCNL